MDPLWEGQINARNSIDPTLDTLRFQPLELEAAFFFVSLLGWVLFSSS